MAKQPKRETTPPTPTSLPNPQPTDDASDTAYSVVKRGTDWVLTEINLATGERKVLCEDLAPITFAKMRIAINKVNGL